MVVQLNVSFMYTSKQWIIHQLYLHFRMIYLSTKARTLLVKKPQQRIYVKNRIAFRGGGLGSEAL